jgi:hypothetical protein
LQKRLYVSLRLKVPKRFRTKVLQKEHWYERDLLRNSRVNRLVDFKSFSAETSATN